MGAQAIVPNFSHRFGLTFEKRDWCYNFPVGFGPFAALHESDCFCSGNSAENSLYQLAPQSSTNILIFFISLNTLLGIATRSFCNYVILNICTFEDSVN